MFTFSSIESTSSNDLISPTGVATSWRRGVALFHKLFGMSPAEFQRTYNAPPENAFISHGYMYVNDGVIQLESAPSGLTTAQIQLVLAYLSTLPDSTHVEIMTLQHDPQTYQLLSEQPFYAGSTQGLRDKMLSSPSMTGEKPVQYNFVPQKGGRPAESGPRGKGQTFSFPSPAVEHTETRTPRTADIIDTHHVQYPDAPKSEDIELQRWDHWGLPVINIGGSQDMAIGTDVLADRAVYMEIMESLWAFNTEWLAQHSRRSYEFIHALQARHEAGNDAIRATIRNKKKFVEDAVAADGRGHFLSSWDGSEHTLDDYFVRVEDLPAEVLRALRINRGYSAGDIYVYLV